MTLTIKEVTTSAEFDSIEQAWSILLSDLPHLSIFLSWKWLNLWWSTYATENDRLHIILVEEHGELIALAPFYIQNNNTFRFIGSGELEIEEVATEYFDIICAPEKSSEITTLLTKYINANFSAILQFEFNNYLEQSTIHMLTQELSKQFWHKTSMIGLRYRAKLPSNFVSFTKQCKPSLIKRVLRHKSKFTSTLAGDFTSYHKLEHLDEGLAILEKLHTQRWNDKKMSGAFSSRKFQQFHANFCRYAIEKEWLQLWILSANNEPICAIYGFQYQDTCYFYQSGVNTHFTPNISPGYLCHLLLIEKCIKRELCYYDFMKGSKVNSYKSKLANDTTPMFDSNLLKKSYCNVPQLVKWYLIKFKSFIK